VTADRAVTIVTGEARDQAAPGAPARSRREYALGLALGAAGAGLVLLSARQGWARVLTPAPPPLPAGAVTVTGQDLVPLAGALGVAALATLAAVIATRGLARRLTGALLAAFGVAIAVAVSLPVTAAEVLSAARVTTISQAGSATAGGSAGVTPGAVPGGASPGVTAVGHVTMLTMPWRPAALVGALVIAAAGLLVAWRGRGWPVMSSRYGRAAQQEQQPSADSAALWEALSRGSDPTEQAAAGEPAGHADHPGGADGAAAAPGAD
jgi:uncharacterized membrane protein (TIGR02234 family)